MSQIQKRLNDLQPYVVGIRFVSNLPVIDVVFKEGWVIPDSKFVHKEQSEQDPNYYLFYSEKEGVGFDELLDYVEEIIRINIEREIKQELLKIKVKELQMLFKENTLDRLKKLKFVFNTENLETDLMDENFTIDIEPSKNVEKQEPISQPKIKKTETVYQEPSPIVKTKKPGIGEVELPPKGTKIELEDHSLPPAYTEGDCDCGPDNYCPKCMDSKGL